MGQETGVWRMKKIAERAYPIPNVVRSKIHTTDKMDSKDLTPIEEQALELMEAGAVMTDGQVERLAQDGELRAMCRDVETLATACRMEREDDDVEAALADFHRRHRLWRSRTGMAAIVLATAAMIVGAVLLLRRNGVTQPLPPGMVYQAAGEKSDVVVERWGADDIVVDANRVAAGLSFRSNADGIDTEGAREVTVRVPEGRSFTAELPDGSRVWLHPGSTIYFPSRFDSDRRWVKLEGEAYFSVVHDGRRPFTVEAGGTETTVRGTEFNVASYAESAVTVTLVSGSVSFAAGGHEAFLTPGMQAVASGDRQPELHAVSTEKYINWRDGFFYFDNTSLREILTEIGRNYGVTVECRDEALLDEHLHFVAERGQSLQAIVDRLKALRPMAVSVSHGVMVVEGR